MFSRSPLNYHTYLARIRRAPPTLSTSQLLDAIDTCRALERAKPPVPPPNALGIATQPSNHQMEKQLHSFLLRHGFDKCPVVVHRYLRQDPGPLQLEQMVGTVLDLDYSHKDAYLSLSKCLLHRMLDARDYGACFRFIDAATTARIAQKKMAVLRGSVYTLGLTGVSSYVEMVLSGLSIPAISLFCALAVLISSLRLSTIDMLTRVRFRPYTSLVYKWMHREELLMVNKVLTHFEEFSETTVRNFHHAATVPSVKGDWTVEGEAPAQMVREEVNRRRMAVNELDEELVFLEYWLDGDARYRWVDADQDPAEYKLYDRDSYSQETWRQCTKVSDAAKSHILRSD